MLEVEVLGHQLLQPSHVHQVVEVDPLGPAAFVVLFLFKPRHHSLHVRLRQNIERLVAFLRVLFTGVHLELHNDLLLEQEVLQVSKAGALDERLPLLELVGVRFLPDGSLKLAVVSSRQLQQLPQQHPCQLPVLFAAEFVHDRQQEDDLVALVEQKVGVVLDGGQQLLVLSEPIGHLAIVLGLAPLHRLHRLLDAAVVDVALEILLLVLLDQVHSVIHHFLLLLELRGVNYHQVLV